MDIEANVVNERDRHSVTLMTSGVAHSLAIASKSGGYGSSANGGELLCLALATCYCNDLYREAAQRGIAIARVEVTARAEFGQPGDPAIGIRYRARVAARASEAAIRDLMRHTDRVAEVQNTLRRGMDLRLESIEAESLPD